MPIFVVITSYMYNHFFGAFSSMIRARNALEDFLASDENIVRVEDTGNYSYMFTDKDGENFYAEIFYAVIDEEFVEG